MTNEKEEIDDKAFRKYVERVTTGFDDEKKARKMFERRLINMVKDHIKSQGTCLHLFLKHDTNKKKL